ncbi:hypothetical protein CsatA_029264 [Cannabis sativa]
MGSPMVEERPPQLIISLSEHYTCRITWRSESYYYPKIKAKLEEFRLWDRVRESPFKQFFEREPLRFLGALIHQLMLHKIKSDKLDEVHFYLAKKRCRFGRVEFGLVTELNLLAGPTEEEIKEKGSSNQLIMEYFNSNPSISLGQLCRVFESCTKVDDVYKLGMALFVMGILTGKEEKTFVPPFVIRMVDNLPFFYEYHVGFCALNKTHYNLIVINLRVLK